MENGFIYIHRQIIKWEWYQDSNTFRLFLHLLLSANHKKNRWQGIEINRGQLVTSLPSLSKNLRISAQSIRTSLTKLKSTGELTDKSTNKYRLITIIKYNDYQHDGIKTTIKSTGKPTDRQQATNRQLTANNNDNNEKNENNLGNKKIPIKNNSIITLKDGTKAKMYFGTWVDAQNNQIKINLSYYPELQKYES